MGWIEPFDISNADPNPRSDTKSNPKSDGEGLVDTGVDEWMFTPLTAKVVKIVQFCHFGLCTILLPMNSLFQNQSCLGE